MDDQRTSENVRVALARQRRTAASVARATGIEPRTLRKLLRAELTWRAGQLDDVAREIDVPIDSLIAR